MPRVGDIYIGPYRFRTKFLDPFYKGNLIRFILVKFDDKRVGCKYGLMPYVAANERGQRVLDALEFNGQKKIIHWVTEEMLINYWKLET